jgi:hypothetical protein
MVTNACVSCKRLTNETTTQRMHGELHPLPMFHFVTYSPATAESFAKVTNGYECPCESCECLRTFAIAYEYVAKTMRICFPGEF